MRTLSALLDPEPIIHTCFVDTQCLAQHSPWNFWQWHHPTFPEKATPSAALIWALSPVRQQALAVIPPSVISAPLGWAQWLQPRGCAQGPWKLSKAHHHGPCPILRHPGEEGSWSWDSLTHVKREAMKRGRRKHQEVESWLNPLLTKSCMPSPKIKML